ncbi:hypothetical protein [Streptomyces sp. MN13]
MGPAALWILVVSPPRDLPMAWSAGSPAGAPSFAGPGSVLVSPHAPLKHRNLNLLGRYSFTASTPAAGALRPLRNPDKQELDEDDDEGGLD